MRWHLWVGVLVSGLLLAIIAWTIDVREAVRALAAADVRWVGPALVILGISLGVRAWRWRFIMAPVKLINTHRLFSAMMIGFMGNNLLPARVGEFMRAYVIGKTQRVSASASLATVVVERLFDGFTLLAMLLVSVLVLHFPVESERLTHHIRTAGWLAFGFYLAVLAVCVLLRLYQAPTRRGILAVLSFLPQRWRAKTAEVLDGFVQGLEVVRGGWHLVPILALSIAAWSIQAVAIWLVLLAFHLKLSLGASFFILAVQSFGVMIPSSPGFIGTFHAASILAMTAYGVGREVALSASIVMHLLFFMPVTVVGLIYLWVENLTLHEMTVASKEVALSTTEDG
ncbi:flippase-like domain-containing protein [Nitrospinae bacterium AH_259_B05_G02_I21]|nr:flippase-like domain-containing protein [Nitrospinae bacterium AH_259_B05_G02_I21]